MDYPYPTMSDARDAWPILRGRLTGQPSDLATTTKATYVVAGFTASLYPGEPGSSVERPPEPAISGEYSDADLVRDLDEALGPQAASEAAGDDSPRPNKPWRKIAGMLLKLFMENLAN